MPKLQVVAARALIAALCSILFLSTPLMAQRSDRGTIGGVVTDSQGSAVPGATVTVRNDDTGVETVLTTNSAGAYTTNPLVLGRYSVKVNVSGFKTSVSVGPPADAAATSSGTTSSSTSGTSRRRSRSRLPTATPPGPT